MSFGCTKCGACCINAREVLNGHPFPFKFLENGQCEKYDPKKGCTIYKDRPDCCRIDAGYEVYNNILPMSKETYYDLSAINCNAWIDKLGLDKIFKIKIKK